MRVLCIFIMITMYSMESFFNYDFEITSYIFWALIGLWDLDIETPDKISKRKRRMD